MKVLIWAKKNSLLTSIMFGAILFLVIFFVPMYAFNAAMYNLSTSELIQEEGLITDSSIFNQIPTQPLKNLTMELKFRKDFLDQGAISYSVYTYQIARLVFFFFGIYGSILIAVVFTVLALINHKRASLWYGIEIIAVLFINMFIYLVFFNIPNSLLNYHFVYEYYPYIGFFLLLGLLVGLIIYSKLAKKVTLQEYASTSSTAV